MEQQKTKFKSFPELEETMRNTNVSIAGTYIPVLNKNTEKIIINCHGGSIVDIKPTLRIK